MHSRLAYNGVTTLAALVAGTAAAAVFWTIGSPELAWLGFVVAALAFAGEKGRCSLRRRRWER